jgi:excisionase family DNA binding protein
MTEDVMLSVVEVAGRLRVSDESIYRLVRSGALRSVRVGGTWRVPQSALDEYVQRQTRCSTEPKEGQL